MEFTDTTLRVEHPDYQDSLTVARGLLNGAVASFVFWVIAAGAFFGGGLLFGWFN